jgi:Bacterial Ig-like domain (group 3)/FG-GAP-like repeat
MNRIGIVLAGLVLAAVAAVSAPLGILHSTAHSGGVPNIAMGPVHLSTQLPANPHSTIAQSALPGQPLNPSHLFIEAPAYPTGMGPESVAVGDFNGDGHPDLVISNGAFGSSTISVLLGAGDGTFQNAVTYDVGGRPCGVAIGDFNRDGKLDIAVSLYATSSSVGVLLGKGDGTFGVQVNYAAGLGACAVAVTDFTGSGNIDLVTANSSSNTVSVLLGNGDGTFRAHIDSATGGGPQGVALGDFNNDGKVDVATVNTTFAANTVSVLLGNGDGTFRPHVEFATGSLPFSVAVGDFNGDGKPDLATANEFGNNVSVLLGNGDGTFQAHKDYAAGYGPSAVAVGDFNHDGKLDLVAASAFGNTVSLLLGNGDGTFQAPAYFGDGAGDIFTAMAVADLNADGNADLVVTNYVQNTVTVLLGYGDGTFRAHGDYGAGVNPYSVAAAELNGDGKIDLVVADQNCPLHCGPETVSVLLGNGDGTFGLPAKYATGFFPTSVAVMDLNGDGIPDLAVRNCGTDSTCKQGIVSIFLGRGDGTFLAAVDYSAGSGLGTVAVGDFNQDGKTDLAVSSYFDNTVSVLLGNGDGTFQPPSSFATDSGPNAVTVGDFNGDGRLDLVSANCGQCNANSGPGTVSVLLGNGDGTFQPHVDYQTGSNAVSVVGSDLNRDSKLDLVTANSYVSSVSVLIGKGDGTFLPHVDYAAGFGPSQLATGDFNSDGKTDLAVTSPLGNSYIVTFLLGKGDGTFLPQVSYQTGVMPQSLAVADFNGDGKPDVATANLATGANAVTILLNTSGTRVKLTSSPNPSKLHELVSFAATVSPTVRGAGAPIGTVTFLMESSTGSQRLGVTALLNGTATINISGLAVGTHKIQAQYSGDATFTVSVSPPITQTVVP